MDARDLLPPLILFALLAVIAAAVIRDRRRADDALSSKVRRARGSFDLLAGLPSAGLALLVVYGVITWLSETEVSPWLLAPVFLVLTVLALVALPAALLWISVAALAHLRKRHALDDGETRELVGAIFPDKYRRRVERRLLGDVGPTGSGHGPT